MFSDVQKGNRRDCAKEKNDLSGLSANIAECVFYDVALCGASQKAPYHAFLCEHLCDCF